MVENNKKLKSKFSVKKNGLELSLKKVRQVNIFPWETYFIRKIKKATFLKIIFVLFNIEYIQLKPVYFHTSCFCF